MSAVAGGEQADDTAVEDLQAASPTGSTAAFRTFTRQNCFNKRSQLLKEKCVGGSEKKAEHERRRVRTKVASVLIEVRKRQELHQVQEKQKKFRQRRHERGRGPRADLGDTTEFAFGITCLSECADESAMTSPRRTALLDSLSPDELGLLREQPAFFFTGNTISAAMNAEQAEANAKVRDLHALGSPSSGSKGGPEAPKGLWRDPTDSSVFEALIEFFSASSADKALDVNVYARNLRAQLLASAGRHNHHSGGGDIDWRAKLCRGDPNETAQEEKPAIAEDTRKHIFEMMPCLGRHPPVRSDEESPTLLKVREVYQRKDEQDAEWVQNRAQNIDRRLALNAFKAREQQRELMLQDFKQKELHKIRILQAEEKHTMLDFEQRERTEVMGIQKIHRMIVANERAERVKEERRDQTQDALEAWQVSVEKAQENRLQMELDKRKEGEINHEKYMKKLIAVAETRKAGRECKTQQQKNDELKANIQVSLSGIQKEHYERECLLGAESYKAKLSHAAQRRQQMTLGSRYGFLEKAFGEDAVKFDPKCHAVAIDRRGKSWQRQAEGWSKIKNSFSAPELPPPRPLSPGGLMTEAGFQALLSEAATMKTSSSAVALGFK